MSDPEHYLQVARSIALYLASHQQADGGFPGPDHYGLASSLWLWARFGDGFAPQIDRARARLERLPLDTHGEFNAYALLNCRDRVGPPIVDPILRRIRFGHRHSANWMLLRAVCRAQSHSPLTAARGLLEARAALARHHSGGFIADRGGVRSFTYHAFCGALLADLWRHRGSRWAAAASVRAARVIAPFVLPNGDALYVGRGQQQIFGYGALLYLLEAAAVLTGDDSFRQHADRVFHYLLAFRRSDGSFPLVLRDGEPAEPWSPASHPGWYSYNRYADYLPFLGCMLLKASDPGVPGFSDPQGQPPLASGLPRPLDSDLTIHHESRYTAVLSRPSGAPTNDLAFPYLCVDGASLFPSYGAESDTPPEALPLPFGTLAAGRPYAFRDRLRYRLTDFGLAGHSRLATHLRRFDFRPDGFTCRDEITFSRPCSFATFTVASFLFRNLRPLPDGSFETSHRGVTARLHLHPQPVLHGDAAISASGPLVALRCTRAPLVARPGETLSVELTVQFR